MYFYLILALQGYCIYHLVKNKNEYYWIFLIIFLPVVGSIIYLISKVYNKRDAEIIQNEITTIINPTKKINDLQKKLDFSETFKNRVDLADAYFEMNDFRNALNHYETSIESSFKNDFYVLKQLIKTSFGLEDFPKTIEYSERIRNKFEFRGSYEQFLYGLALEKMQKTQEAENELKQINNPNSNYEERLGYAKFLLRNKKETQAEELLEELIREYKYMVKDNKRRYKVIIVEAEKLLKNINN